MKLSRKKKKEKKIELFLKIHQISLEALIKDSDFIFDCVHLLFHKHHTKIWIVVDHIWISLIR